MKIRNKLIITMLIVSIVPVVIIGTMAMKKSQHALTNQIFEKSLENVRLIKLRLFERIYTKYEDIRAWSHAEPMNEIASGDKNGEISKYLSFVTQNYNEYFYLVCTDTNGKIIASDNSKIIGTSISETKEFKESISGKPTIQDPVFNNNINDYSLAFSFPVRNPKTNKITGVLISYVKWNLFNKMTSELQLSGKPQDKSNHIMISTYDGLVISCFDSKEIFNDNLIQLHIQSAIEAHNQKEGQCIEITEHKIPAFATYSYLQEYKDLPQTRWLIMYYQNPEIVFSSVRSIQNLIIIVIIITICIIIFLTIFLSRKISKPILLLASSAEIFGKDELYETIEIQSNDEIGILAQSFNSMFLKIQHSKKELLQSKNIIEESESKFRSYIENAPEGIFIVDEKGNYVEVNAAASKITGYSKNELLTMSVSNITYVDDLEDSFHNFLLLQENGFSKIQIRFLHKNGAIRWWLVEAVKLSDTRFLGFTKDITDSVNAEILIKKQNAELVNLNADKNRFISILAHDLRSPFQGLLGFTELLQRNIRKGNFEKIEEYVLQIHKTANGTFNLLEDILLWGKAQSGKLPFEPQTLRILEIVNEIIEKFDLNIAQKNIKVTISIYDNITVFADKDMLKTILRNLIFNAIKFTNQNGQIVISTEKDSGKTKIFVSDNGVGMTSDIISKLFDISQSHSTVGTANETGTGLGLLLCKEFAEKHGGEIWVESKPERGSSFFFTLPESSLTRSDFFV